MTRADQRKFHYIYKITRNDGSGKYYIGLHSTDDLNDGYFGSGQLLWKSIKKYGKEAHTKEILEFLPSRSALRERERELVNEITLLDDKCLNLCVGGGFADAHSEETKTKLSRALKGKPKSEITKAKISEAKRGVPRSEETKMTISLKQKGIPRPHSPEHEAARLEGIRKYWDAQRAAKNR